ncbi:ATPase- F0 complex- subunit B/B-bacterial/chloroplast [Striga hermonthica]|uniref:ATPase- F0 complex- subunit B/B-bacterial/chloroplast n=1 Tax=Striga hermonthica TaxID=68872 RepID=A0A9N7NEV2_STRHE|nr:ATPase- F0 complex- subunit B/B-bacterial/chloroplast [Striga hermonthica]
MANMIMASHKTLTTPSIPPVPKPILRRQTLPKIALPKFLKPHQLPSLLAAATTFSLAHAPPSLAADIEKAALFDFNLTLPIIALEFLFLMAARAEIAAALNKMKKDSQEEVEARLAEGMNKLEAELEEALAGLERQKEETIKALDSQIAALSEEIVKKVLPVS